MAKSKKSFSFKRLKWFTLVELIVVITILAILGTIGFLSIGGYSSKARDSVRVSDLAQVSKSLDLSIVTSGAYPIPDNSFAVTYSGGTVWNQGTVWSGVMQYFRGTIAGGWPGKKPEDPLKNTEYAYSSLAEGKAYQIKAEYEGELAPSTFRGGFLLDSANAAAWNPTTAYIRGNFGGLTAKASTGATVYILAIPSIITSTGAANAILKIEQNALSGTLLFNGRPLADNNGYDPKVVHSGVAASGNGLPTTSTGMLSMMGALRNAYSGNAMPMTSGIASLLAITDTGSLISLGDIMVKNELGGKYSASSNGPQTSSSSISGNDSIWRKWADGTHAKSCFEYKNSSGWNAYGWDIGNGIYWINPTWSNSFKAYCDMTTDGGGWTILWKNRSTGGYAHAPWFYNDGNVPTNVTAWSISLFDFPNTIIWNSTVFYWKDTVTDQYVSFNLSKIQNIKASPDSFTQVADGIGLRFLSSSITSSSSLYQFCATSNVQNPANAGNFSYGVATLGTDWAYGFAWIASWSENNKRIFTVSNHINHECSYGTYWLQRYGPAPSYPETVVFWFR